MVWKFITISEAVWLFPPMISFFILLYFLIILNRKRRKVLSKMTFSTFLISMMTYSIVSVLRYMTLDITLATMLTKISIICSLSGGLFLLLTPLVIYMRNKLNYLYSLLFIPISFSIVYVLILSNLTLSRVDGSWMISPDSMTQMVMGILSIIHASLTPFLFYKVYRRTKKHLATYSQKMLYFTLGSVIFLLSYIVCSFIAQRGIVPLTVQTVPIILGVTAMFVGYLRR